MLKFSCQCGKEFKFPDRVAGREIRCGQCQKTLIVPDSSQDEPVIPKEDPLTSPETVDVVEQEPEVVEAEPVLKAEPVVEAEVVKATAKPVAESPVKKTKPVVEVEVAKAAPVRRTKDSKSESVWGTVPLPDAANGKVFVDRKRKEAFKPSETRETPRRGTLFFVIPLVFLLLVGAFGLGYLLRGLSKGGDPAAKRSASVAGTEADDVSGLIRNQVDALKGQAEVARNELAASLKFPASEAAEALKETDRAKRTAAMKTLSERREKLLADWNDMLHKERTVDFLTSLPERSSLALPVFETAVGDWSIAEQTPIPFAVRSADGAPALVSLDGNPAEKNKGANTLDDVAAAFSDDDGKSDAQMHTISLRVDSGSSRPVRLTWPARGEAALEGDKIKELRFSWYLSEKVNAVFKPGKPDGIDKVLECSSIALRLSSDTGFVEFVPANNDVLVSLVQQARRGWAPQRIPIRGDDVWKRNDYGLVGPLLVRRIELVVGPTGEGVTFWVDHLGVGR